VTEVARPMISVDDVTFRYGRGSPVLEQVNMDVPAGQVVGLAGRNGSGKTTLARLLNGLLRPTSGTVRVGDIDTRTTSVQALAAHVAFAFQNPSHQLFATTVAAELAFGPRNLGVGQAEIESRVADAAARLGLEGLLDRHPYQLERGVRKLVAIASVVTMRAPVLVLDEPTTGQDRRTSGVVARLIGELRDAGTTVVCVSHDMRLLADVADRLVLLDRGGAIADGTPRAVFSDAAAMEVAGLRPPQVTGLALRLRPPSADWPPLTVEALAEAIRDGSADPS
jgi:energy-coupling factor transporter ATP-binding protein EcfA2